MSPAKRGGGRDARRRMDRAERAQRGCAVCGERDARLLHWHHRPGEVKHGSPGNMPDVATMRAEWGKCDVLCVIHHDTEHHGERAA